MSSIHDRLQQLLDGEIDAADIADDPTLVSLADRIYGIKIAAVQPTKPRDANAILTPVRMSRRLLHPPICWLKSSLLPCPRPLVPLPDPNMALNMPPCQPAKKSTSVCVCRRSCVLCAQSVRSFSSAELTL